MGTSTKVVGRLLPNHSLFEEGDEVCKIFRRLGVFDVDTEELCHKEISNLICEVPGCGLALNSVMELELHYNSIHRYTCATCRKSAASAHLLDLHIEETHDSFFAVQAERKPMYRCLVEECCARFSSSQERHCHCVDHHAFPANFRWVTPKVVKQKFKKTKVSTSKIKGVPVLDSASSVCPDDLAMDVDGSVKMGKTTESGKQVRSFVFGRGKMKKSFNSNSSDWHRKENRSSNVSALEGSLSSDLMESLLSEEMS